MRQAVLERRPSGPSMKYLMKFVEVSTHELIFIRPSVLSHALRLWGILKCLLGTYLIFQPMGSALSSVR